MRVPTRPLSAVVQQAVREFKRRRLALADAAQEDGEHGGAEEAAGSGRTLWLRCEDAYGAVYGLFFCGLVRTLGPCELNVDEIVCGIVAHFFTGTLNETSEDTGEGVLSCGYIGGADLVTSDHARRLVARQVQLGGLVAVLDTARRQVLVLMHELCDLYGDQFYVVRGDTRTGSSMSVHGSRGGGSRPAVGPITFKVIANRFV